MQITLFAFSVRKGKGFTMRRLVHYLLAVSILLGIFAPMQTNAQSWDELEGIAECINDLLIAKGWKNHFIAIVSEETGEVFIRSFGSQMDLARATADIAEAIDMCSPPGNSLRVLNWEGIALTEISLVMGDLTVRVESETALEAITGLTVNEFMNALEDALIQSILSIGRAYLTLFDGTLLDWFFNAVAVELVEVKAKQPMPWWAIVVPVGLVLVGTFVWWRRKK